MSYDETIEADGRDKQSSPPCYRVFILGHDYHVIHTENLAVKTDEEALSQARSFSKDHAVELWDGLRFIENFGLANASK